MLKVTTKMTGKMGGMVSINTSSLDNDYCAKMSQTDSVCGSCYSNRLLSMYKSAELAFSANGLNLSSQIWELRELPRLNHHTVRFNAYGELINMEHFVNLMNICRINPKTTFTLWTKKKGPYF